MIMTTDTIRQKFIDFFKKKGHLNIAASRIVNPVDADLLFVNSGMYPFRKIFLGNSPAPASRVVNSQPCLRVSGKHNDLEEVGHDTYHHTLFEMLGNWSFGDYFKEEAISYAWELLNDVYHLPSDRLYVTYFGGDSLDKLKRDEETLEFWKKYIPLNHIKQEGKKDNFWEMGSSGPCGPCTEIHIDLRSEEEIRAVAGLDLINKDHPKVIELWNLVFMEYNREANGNLVPLTTKHVDTGMGLERLSMALQNKNSTYEIDVFMPIIDEISKMAGVEYGKGGKKDIAIRVLADHLRAIAFSISDGQRPSSQQAGYVIRRILRRAVRYGYQYLGFRDPFMYLLYYKLLETLGSTYGRLLEEKKEVMDIIKNEEKLFLITLSGGIKRFEILSRQASDGKIKGQNVFMLYDTYGFPPDLTSILAAEKGLEVDMDGFYNEMKTQKARSKTASSRTLGDWQRPESGEIAPTIASETEFVGYDKKNSKTSILSYRTIDEGGKKYYQILLEKTPFYPQGGGQVGDSGLLFSESDESNYCKIIDTYREDGLIVHKTNSLPIKMRGLFIAKIDKKRRALITNNHSATHLLDAALRSVVGSHVVQKGSYIDDKKLRFDFSHSTPLTDKELEDVEKLVNHKIRENIPLTEERSISFDEAKRRDVLMLDNEQYGGEVRVITFDENFSKALCGGTHVERTGNIGFFKIFGDVSAAAGIRRIEAITSVAAEQWVRRSHREFMEIRKSLSYPTETLKALENLQNNYKECKKTLKSYQKKILSEQKNNLIDNLKNIGGVFIGVIEVKTEQASDLRKLLIDLEKSINPIAVVLISVILDNVYVAAKVSKGVTKKINASEVINYFSTFINGSGGGNETFALIKGEYKAGKLDILVEGAKYLDSILEEKKIDS